MDAGSLHGAVETVIANRADAAGLAIASARGIATRVVEHQKFTSRDAFDAALASAIDASAPDLIVLAGFMRMLGAAFVGRYTGRMINIHPSLLPLYPGLHTHRRALADGVRVHGCTVHFVTPTSTSARHRAGRGAGVQRRRQAALAARVLRRNMLCRRSYAGTPVAFVIDGARVHVRDEETARKAGSDRTSQADRSVVTAGESAAN
jgi:phosphoribosylglycinamide formyltransferase-1